MEYSDINLRLQVIRRDIHDLSSVKTTTIMSKIDTLRFINRLLKEQNKLLAEKQQIELADKPAFESIRMAL